MSDDGFEEKKYRSSSKRKHVTLTIQEKLEIINLVDEGFNSRQAIANIYGIGKSTVHDIHKRKNKIREFASMYNGEDISKRRRVDVNKNPLILKSEQTDEFSIDAKHELEEVDYQEMNEECDVIYDPIVKTEVMEPELEPLRRKKTLTIREKYDIVKMFESGTSVHQICEMFEIGRTTVYDFIKSKQKIIDFIENSNNDGVNRRTFKQSKYPLVENSMIEYCQTMDQFTKQQFFDTTKSFFNHAQSGEFFGAWSWSKRFFDRHTEFKKKLVSDNGEKLEDVTFIDDQVEYLEEAFDGSSTSTPNYKSFNIGHKQLRFPHEPKSEFKKNKRPNTYLTLSEKLQVLKEIDAGKNINVIADRWGVSKSTIYDIFKRRDELRDFRLTKSNYLRKVMKVPRYAELERELLSWCLSQKSFPLSNVLIADKALCLFDSMDLKGTFNPSSSWGKKFVLRHPELRAKQGLPEEEELIKTEEILQIGYQSEYCDEDEEEISEPEYCETNDMAGSFEFMDPGNPSVYEEEFVVEELEIDHSEITQEIEQEQIDIEEPQPEIEEIPVIEYQSYEEKPEIKQDLQQIPDQIALKSLKILIKYSHQRGKSKYLSSLLELQNELEQELSSDNL